MRRIALLLSLIAAPAWAQFELALPPGSIETARLASDLESYTLPVGRFQPDLQPSLDLEGRALTRAWRTPAERADTLSTMRVVRPQLLEAGFATLFECETVTCGGFDFRFNTEVLPPPAMEFDLTDFRFLAARRGTGSTAEHVSVLISRSPRGGHIQMVEITPASAGPPELATPETPVQSSAPDTELADQLIEVGRVVLNGVTFPPGARTLDEAAIATLAPLAEFLQLRPDINLILVGHTDNEGGLDSNIAVSRARAQAVRAALIERYGIAPARLEAAGVGYLAPLVPNTSEEGQARNRRVEAVLR